jgi:hypothetical protein
MRRGGDIFSLVANGDRLLCIIIIVRTLALYFLVPLKSSFLQILVDNNPDSGWRVTVYPEIGHALVAIYSVLIFLTILMLARLWNYDTGLKWDPVSIADQVALVQRSNLLDMYDGLEFATQYKCAEELRERGPRFGTLRLGYWRHRTNGSIWHGLACVPTATGMTLLPLKSRSFWLTLGLCIEIVETSSSPSAMSKVFNYLFGGNQEHLRTERQDSGKRTRLHEICPSFSDTTKKRLLTMMANR